HLPDLPSFPTRRSSDLVRRRFEERRTVIPDMKIPAKGAPGLTLEEMKQFVRDHFEEFVNQKKSEVAFKNFSTDFLDHDEPTGVEVGPEAAKKMMETAYKRWPDLKVAIEDILAEEDKVVIRNSWTGREADRKSVV